MMETKTDQKAQSQRLANFEGVANSIAVFAARFGRTIFLLSFHRKKFLTDLRARNHETLAPPYSFLFCCCAVMACTGVVAVGHPFQGAVDIQFFQPGSGEHLLQLLLLAVIPAMLFVGLGGSVAGALCEKGKSGEVSSAVPLFAYCSGFAFLFCAMVSGLLGTYENIAPLLRVPDGVVGFLFLLAFAYLLFRLSSIVGAWCWSLPHRSRRSKALSVVTVITLFVCTVALGFAILQSVTIAAVRSVPEAHAVLSLDGDKIHVQLILKNSGRVTQIERVEPMFVTLARENDGMFSRPTHQIHHFRISEPTGEFLILEPGKAILVKGSVERRRAEGYIDLGDLWPKNEVEFMRLAVILNLVRGYRSRNESVQEVILQDGSFLRDLDR